MSYKKLGEYIEVIDDRNKNLNDYPLLGVSVQKRFIVSIANTVGTDFSKYKILSENEFTYIPDTSRRGDKIGVALLKGYSKALVSQAYTTFRVSDINKLLPEYLMMWFSRPEFDRYARYHSIGSVREVFDWEDMCDVELPVPSIEKQREIVAQYQAVANKIKVNEQICEKLEATAQTLYKHWFVDFEFPISDTEVLEVTEGVVSSASTTIRGYKSSGGTMVFNEELEKEIPEGWEVLSIGDIFNISGGGTPKTEVEEYWKDGDILWYSPTDLTKSKSIHSYDTDKKITNEGLKNSSAKLLPIGSILMTSRATIGKVCFNEIESSTNQGFINILPHKLFSKYFIYCWIQDNLSIIHSLSTGSTFLEISKGSFNSIKFLKSDDDDLYKQFDDYIKSVFVQIRNIEFQTKKLTQLQSLLLSRLARLEHYKIYL